MWKITHRGPIRFAEMVSAMMAFGKRRLGKRRCLHQRASERTANKSRKAGLAFVPLMLLLCLWGFNFSSMAAEKYSLDKLAFLSGDWQGKSKDGSLQEEYWSKLREDGFVGYCRFIKNGKCTFMEFMTISETANGIVLRIKHFDGNMIPWKEEDESGDCKLSAVKGTEAIFESSKNGRLLRIKYKRAGKILQALVEEIEKDKNTKSYNFEYRLLEE